MSARINHINNARTKLNFETILPYLSDAVLECSLTGEVLNFNPAVKDIFGTTLNHLFEITIVSQNIEWNKHLNRVLSQEIVHVDCFIKTNEEMKIPLCIILLPRIVEQEVTAIYCIARKIKEKSEQVDLNLYSVSEFHEICNQLHVGIFSVDRRQKKVIFASKGLGKIFEVNPQNFLEDESFYMTFIHPDDLKLVKQGKADLLKGRQVVQKYRILTASGIEKWVQDQTIPYFNSEGELFRLDGIVTDITDQVASSAQISHTAYHDHVTGLPNQRLFIDKLERLIIDFRTTGKHFAVLCLDIDRFKYINDTVGRAVGDILLKQTSDRIQSILGKGTFLARAGGDEFALYVKDLVDSNAYIEVAEKIIKEMEKPFQIKDYELTSTISIGMSVYPLDGEDSITLLRHADFALGKAKESGRNGWRMYSLSDFSEKMTPYEIERGLRKAIEKEEFFVVYQPKVDINTGKVIGAEALIRWLHPTWGLISPGQFIPIAEANGYIFRIGDWVIEQVCIQIKKWQEAMLPVVPISINLSPKRLLNLHFVEQFIAIVNEAKVVPNLLEIELTETAVITNPEITRKTISELKKIGIKFALDDFGTGYSSLSHLKDLDIDIIKIDKSFIREITTNPRYRAIMKSILFLAEELGIQIVVEGVETLEQLEFLKVHHFQIIQGFLFSKPVREDEFGAIMQKGVLQVVQ